MSKEDYFVLKPFGPSIVKLKIPENLVDKLNSYVDKVVDDKKKSSQLDHGAQLAGMVTQEFKLEQAFMEEAGWGRFLATACQKWIELVYKKKI